MSHAWPLFFAKNSSHDRSFSRSSRGDRQIPNASIIRASANQNLESATSCEPVGGRADQVQSASRLGI
jgi:hypothetical protein